MGYDCNGYVKTVYMVEENIKMDTCTGGRASDMENKNWSRN